MDGKVTVVLALHCPCVIVDNSINNCLLNYLQTRGLWNGDEHPATHSVGYGSLNSHLNVNDSKFLLYENTECLLYFMQSKNQHTHTQPFNGLLSGTTRVGRYQKKHSPTHTHPDHWTSFIIFLHLQPSMASSVLVYELDSPLGQPLSRFSLVFLLALDPQLHKKVKGKVFPYSLPSVGPGADPGVQAVSPQVT